MLTLYHRTTHRPLHISRLLRDTIVVKRYSKPAVTPGGIVVPEQSRDDRTQTLWEVVMGNPRADEAMGMAIPVGAIVQTLRRWPQDLNAVDSDGNDCFLLSMEASGIRGIITYDDNDAADAITE